MKKALCVTAAAVICAALLAGKNDMIRFRAVHRI